ncbi:MAG: pyridoxal phosphate-dependent aminotransferase family protein [Bacteroidota bacterium]
MDFCSNDYLGLARSPRLSQLTAQFLSHIQKAGATGSRLITGNHSFIEELEQEIAQFHEAEAALLHNSGFDANLGLLSCIATKEDSILSDQLIHASLIDGIRLSKAQKLIFRHNDLQHLEAQLKKAQGQIFVIVESVYSMDGDSAPLLDIEHLCRQYQAHLIVDEAHATGVFGKNGRGLVSELGLTANVFARVITFGKALGAHGAAVLGSHLLRDYLINFSRPFIFSTGLPMHSIASIKAAYLLLAESEPLLVQLKQNIDLLKKELAESVYGSALIPSESAIQCMVIPGAEKAKALAANVERAGFYAKAIVYPTVAKGEERIRFCLHSFNEASEIKKLIACLKLAESAGQTSG